MQRNNERIIAGGRKICGNGERKFRENRNKEREVKKK